MKRCFSVFIIFVLFAVYATAAPAEKLPMRLFSPQTQQYFEKDVRPISLIFDGEPLLTDVPAFLEEGRTMVPVRVIAETLNAQVTWEQSTRQVVISRSGMEIVLTVGSAEALVGGEAVRLYDSVPATLCMVNGAARIMAPLRFVSEQLGAEVQWDGETYEVAIFPEIMTRSEVTVPIVEDGAIVFHVEGDAQPVMFTLSERIVIDLPGAVFSTSGGGAVETDFWCVSRVRYNQFDSGYEQYDRVARVVLDLQNGAKPGALHMEFLDGTVRIQPVSASPENPETKEQDEPEEELAPIIVIDAGHGGADPGAQYGGVDEKTLTLAIAGKVSAYLRANGCTVLETRTDDQTVTLGERTKRSNEANAALFISIHANAVENRPLVNGAETYCVPGAERALSLAKCVQQSIANRSGAVDRGTHTARFYVLVHTECPAVLVETGYMSNESELKKLCDEAYQDVMAEAIAEGILTYLG